MEAHLHLYEMMLSAAKPMALKAAVLPNIPQIIATHGKQNLLSVGEIAEHISASTKQRVPQKESSFRILRLLASCGVFTEDVDDQTKQMKYGLNRDYVSSNAEANKLFNEGMACHTKDVMESVVKMYDGFSSLKSIVDVAGGVGSTMSAIVAEHSHIRGINFNLPHVIVTAPPITGVTPHLN